jgi:hypothetical protein
MVQMERANLVVLSKKTQTKVKRNQEGTGNDVPEAKKKARKRNEIQRRLRRKNIMGNLNILSNIEANHTSI